MPANPLTIDVVELREVANAPEVHAAAILAAKDYLLQQEAFQGVSSERAAASIGLHAALILRSYLIYLDPAAAGAEVSRTPTVPGR